MALATFFPKNALAASYILQGLDFSALEQLLDKTTIGIAFNKSSRKSYEEQICLEMAVNLLARFYPRISFITTEGRNGKFLGNLIRLAQDINPQIEILYNELNSLSALLVVGKFQPPTLDVRKIYVGSDNWFAQVSTNSPRSFGSSINPLGAATAACLGVANVFRTIFKDHLGREDLDNDLSFSVFDLSINVSNAPNPVLKAVQLDETFLVGIGAIGNGTVWALSKIKKLNGVLHLIDHESLDTTNLQRYVISRENLIGKAKSEIAKELFTDTGLVVYAHTMKWGEYLANRQNFYLPSIAVAVDSAKERRAIQAALPLWIANSWTMRGSVGISRHYFLGEAACLMCLYMPSEPLRNEDEIIAEAVGLEINHENLLAVRHLLYTNQPIGAENIKRIAAALNVPVEPLLIFHDQPLSSFYSQAICGGIVLALQKDIPSTMPTRIEVPLAFESALAGILLASEIVIHACNFGERPLFTVTSLDLLTALKGKLSRNEPKHKSGNCICQDEYYVNSYKSKYLS